MELAKSEQDQEKIQQSTKDYLDSLPDHYKTIHINKRGLTEIPENINRFKNLEVLNCSDNQLTKLPILPKTLRIIICNNNKLRYLATYKNPLPDSLEVIDCSYNNLEYLEPFAKGLPPKLKKLICNNNWYLNYIPELPQSLHTMMFYRTPQCYKYGVFKLHVKKYTVSNYVREHIIKEYKQMISYHYDYFALTNNNYGIHPINSSRIKVRLQMINKDNVLIDKAVQWRSHPKHLEAFISMNNTNKDEHENQTSLEVSINNFYDSF